MKVAFCRLYIKDIEYNIENIINFYNEAVKKEIDIVVFPRLCINGLGDTYNPDHDKYVEKVLDITMGEKTKILVGGIYKDEENKIYDSAFFIDDGYIDTIISRKEIDKNNILDDYKYFDKNNLLSQFIFKKKKFSVLLSDDIYSNFNIFLVSDNKPDYIICLDTSIKDIEYRKKHLIKLAKFANSPVLYLNNAAIYNNNYFKGELILINEDFEIKHYDIYKNNELFVFDIDCEDGTELFIKNNNENNFDISYLFKKDNVLVDIDNINKEDIDYIKDLKILDKNILFKYINEDLYKNLSIDIQNKIKWLICKNFEKFL